MTGERVSRLIRTPLREVVARGVERAWGACERLSLGREPVSPQLDGARCERILRALATRPFFGVLAAGSRSGQIEKFAAYFPNRVADCLAEADSICGGTVRIFDQEVALRPDGVCWNVDWKNGGAFPQLFYRTVSLDDPGVAAEAKRVWELNRHQFLVTLAKAYWLSSEEKYAQCMIAIVESWIAANPPYRGVNWKDSLELALRLASWTWALRLIAQSAALTPDVARRVVSAIALQRDHIERHLSTYSSPNTHLLGEALGLLIVGCYLPDLPRARRGVDRALAILDAELERQVAQDGSHREKSVYYHAYALEMYLLALIAGRQNGRMPSDRWGRRLEAMAEFLSWLVRPDGSIARFGDDDGGRMLRLAEEDYYRPSSLIALAASLFARGDFKHVAGEPPEELFWLLGDEGVRRFASLRAEAPRQLRRRFPDARIAVVRSGWQARDLWLACDEHPMGFLTSGHSHGGLLSFELFMRGRPVVVDPGTFTYSTRAGWRDHFRMASAHNVVEIDARAMFETEGPFRWKPSAGIDVVGCDGGSDLEIRAACRCDGRVAQVSEHVRTWTVETANRLRVADTLVGEGRHRVKVWLHFAHGARARVRSATLVEVAWDDATVDVVLEGFAAPRASILEGSVDPIAGWLSPSFDHKLPAPALLVEDDAELPTHRTMVLTMRRNDGCEDAAEDE
jgi:Heparinase II/III N-terminus/Heparinase II/III-like protein